MPYSQPIAQLYHATNKANLESIRHHGLRVKFCGAVHGGMEVRPPVPTVYLSRRRHSSNLHSDLFASTVVVLQIDMAQLDPEAFYPDDGLLAAVANGDILASPASIRRSLGLSAGEAATLHDRLGRARGEDFAEILRPHWRWALTHPLAGEVAYAKDIRPSAIVGVRPHPSSPVAIGVAYSGGAPELADQPAPG